MKVRALLLATLLALPARAQESDADKLFREARALMEQGNFERACPKLEESQRLDPGEGTLANLAECYERVGKLADALATWRKLLQGLPANHERRDFVRAKTAELLPKIPTLTIRLPPGAPKATEVTLDGEPAKIGAPITLNPGPYVVEVKEPLRAAKRYDVTLGEGEKRELVVGSGSENVDDLDADSTAPLTNPEAKSNGKRTTGFISLAIGGAALLGYGAIELALLGDCGGNKRCGSDPAGKQRGAQVLFGLGAVGVGIGTVLVLTSKSTEEPERVTIIRPLLGRRGGALTIERRF